MGSNTEQWRSLVEVYWSAELVDRAVCIMGYESGGNTYAASPTDDHGLMQIHWPIWGSVFGVSRADLYDPETNLRLAHQIYEKQGWNAWTPYRVRGKCRG
jgi:soluble lytic murein transglycosylase-like protein